MFRNEKAAPGATGNGFSKSSMQTKQKIDVFNFRVNGKFSQCKKCNQPTANLSFDGLCLNCEQRAEFIWREVLTPTQRAQILRGAV